MSIPMTQGLSRIRYLTLAWTTTLALYAVAAVCSWMTPDYYDYYESEQYAWVAAKLRMVRDCELAPVVFLGDSRLVADIAPKDLPFSAVNLGVIGTGPIETYFLLRRILTCPNQPTTVVLALSPYHFSAIDFVFWDQSVRFGVLNTAEVAELVQDSYRLSDWSIFSRHGVVHGIFGALVHPALAFGALIDDHFTHIRSENRETIQQIMASRGYRFLGYSKRVLFGPEVELKQFAARPVIDVYFDRMLRLLQDKGIHTKFVTLPLNQATAEASAPDVLAGLRSYLAPYQDEYPRFEVLNAVPAIWPNKFFGDIQGHLSPEGAQLFSNAVGRCLNRQLDMPDIADNGSCPELSDMPRTE